MGRDVPLRDPDRSPRHGDDPHGPEPPARRVAENVRALRHRIHEVPVADCNRWLADRKQAGADVDPKVWVGLLLAERHFPRWARARLCAAIARMRSDAS
jgi:hypothetical protein